MQIIETKGNQNLLNKEKTLFLCSKMTPIGLYGYVFKWTDSLTEKDCIVCFNSTDMESEVLKALLVAKVPTILFVMNRFTDVNNIQIEQALKENRMLIVILRRDEPRGKGSMAEEQTDRHERWTVAQDKMLLRMFYDDMGIHAIHKQLQRTYAAVYARLHSITQPEELLKGREFEDYVLSLFNIQEGGELVLQEWQGDKSYGIIKPKNNSNPDFVFRYRQNEFAVECKWREKLSSNWSKDLFPTRRIENYKHFSEVRHMPVTIILGVGGEPCNPELLYKIPLEGVVTKQQFDAYCKVFLSRWNNPLASATRLLCIKRPDTFVCVDSKNKDRLCKAFGIPKNSLTLETYWEKIVMRVRDASWFNDEGSSHSPMVKKIKKYQVAMLDALYYEGK